MKCPECGNEIGDGHLICEVCGYEVQIVPDFEPDIEPQIDNNIVGDVLGDSILAEDDITTTQDLLDTTEQVAVPELIRRRLVMFLCIALATLVIIFIAVWGIRRTSDPDHQLNRARNLAAQGKYEDAISSLENLYVSQPDNSEILYLESDYYMELGKTDLAVDTLKRMISSDRYSADEIYSAYDRLINIYAEAGNYDAIAVLLDECKYSEITLAYQNYVAFPPVFSYEEGTYDNAIRLKISANTSGTVYYTLDGSVPNESSPRYDSPIVLDHGEYVVSAVFINQYGIVSDMVTGTYNISNNIPDAPVVNADSGDYHTPVLIKVEVPEGYKVYYTTDRSVPTVDSVQYIDPIPMPVKYSNFNFAAISEDGLTSEVVVRSYSLTFPDGIPLNEAVDILKARLIERGMLNDMNGHSDRAPGRYTYEVISAIPIAGQGDYYTIREFYHDGTGAQTPTDTTYIVEIHQGSTAMLGGDAVTGFLAISF
ncbi:MAG: chitobiase/beta-hexosaminidase C-terminal domain-containing protein [Lachnospiraceae bacterium]|nr:chitobiase/beta-hexosaminidase C-terminal domain-containing protein [Lachnospiraceae bacterium]